MIMVHISTYGTYQNGQVYNDYGTFFCFTRYLASFPGSPPRAHVYCVTFDLHEESGRARAGEFYHVSDGQG